MSASSTTEYASLVEKALSSVFERYASLDGENAEENMDTTPAHGQPTNAQSSNETAPIEDVYMDSESDSEGERKDTRLFLTIKYSDDEEESMSVNGEQRVPVTTDVRDDGLATRLPRREHVRWQKPRLHVRHERYRAETNARCSNCEAYEAHNKAAAETYRRTLSSYTKTVSELMLGLKTLVERYPELRADSSDERVYYMVQAALGRNNLVQEMIRLAATCRRSRTESECHRVAPDAIADVHEALNVCYTDGEALRMILARYTDLYVKYIQVWREMCNRVSDNLTVLDFIELTEDRPGVRRGAPLSEAVAYASRIQANVNKLLPDDVSQQCVASLSTLKHKLSRYDRRDSVLSSTRESMTEIADVRDVLDARSPGWGWDAHMTELYMDVRSDLTVLETLVGVGRLSVATLLHDRSMLISRLRKLNRDLGSAELALREVKSQGGSSRDGIGLFR